MENSEMSFMPVFDGVTNHWVHGLTKGEYATIQFIAAHLQAHGKYPDPGQARALRELADFTLNVIVERAPDLENEMEDDQDFLSLDQHL
jgi:hypothetical protein